VFPFPKANLTEPSGVITPHQDTQRSFDEDTVVGNQEEI
jgi:hypothetical protein